MEDKKAKIVEKKVEKKPEKKMYRVINFGKEVLGIYDNDGNLFTLKKRMTAIIDRIPEPRNGLVVEEMIETDKYKIIDIEKEYQIAEKKRFKEKRFKELNRKKEILIEEIKKVEKG